MTSSDSAPSDGNQQQRTLPPLNPILSKSSMYAFDLPLSILDSLTLRKSALPQLNQSIKSTAEIQSDTAQNGSSSSSLSCSICPPHSQSPTPAAYRAHLATDWHRFNLVAARTLKSKAQSNGSVRILSEEEFEKLVDEIESSSEEEDPESSSDDSDSERDPTAIQAAKNRSSSALISRLLSRLSISSSSSSGSNAKETQKSIPIEEVPEVEELLDSTSSRSAGVPRSPLYWFVDNQKNPSIQLEQTQLGIYRSLFPVPSEQELNSNPEWHSKTLSSIQAGHFISDNKSSRSESSHKRLKGNGIQDAAIPLGLVVLDGRNQLKSMGLTEDIEEEEEEFEESDSEESETESSVISASVSQYTPSPNDGLVISPPDLNVRTFTIILYGGGHFAASIIALPLSYTPPTRKGVSEKGVLVLASKTFHRYTTRRKQGGSQSSHDGSGSFAKSVGASLRRAGEAALKEEVRDLLGSRIWRQLLSNTEKVFVQGNVREARGMLWNWENSSTSHTIKASPLEESKKDGRVQNIPFVTKRPTLSECLRVFFELTKVKITRKSEEELRSEDENYYQLLRGGKKGERERERLENIKKKKEEERLRKKELEESKLKEKLEKSKSQLSPEELRRRDRFERLVGVIRKGKLGAMVDLLGKYEIDLFRGEGGWDGEKIGNEEEEASDEQEEIERRRKRINADLPTWWRIEQASADPKNRYQDSKAGQPPSQTGMGPLVPNNLLQLAAETGDEEILKYLLVERRADPTLSIPPVPQPNSNSSTPLSSYPHRTAYDLLPTKSSRNVFRRIMALNPDWYAWDSMDFGGARIPAALNFQKEQLKKDKMKDRRNMLREKAKARESNRASSSSSPSPSAKVEEEKKEPQAEVKSNPTRNRLGGPGNGIPTALKNQKDQEAGLTPEMKMRIEREKRARAAEARLKGLGSK